VLRDLAEVLAHAHQHGVVHGGLRPDHVVLANRPHGFALCVTDWSSARPHDATPMPYTPTIDSYHYTAPELQNAQPADHHADSYSLGVIAHQLMSGLPYARGKPIATAAIPQDILGLVEGMLAEDPNDRPSCRDVHRETMNLVDALSQQMTVPSHFRIRKPKWTPDVLYRKLGDAPGRDAFDPDEDVE
jgi:serine/threonine-protein kinase